MSESEQHPAVPGEPWTVTHLYYRVRPQGVDDPAQAGKELTAALAAFTDDGTHQLVCSSVLGLKADLGLMAVGPDPHRHDALARALGAGVCGRVLTPGFSYVSTTEISEYVATPEETRDRLLAEHGPEGLDARVAEAEERLTRYRQDRLHPRLPNRSVLCFYPMSKRRELNGNWYQLPFEERRKLMGGHARLGRQHRGKVLQVVTASTGLDDLEWGVTLLADDLTAVKNVVYEMRFDEVSAVYSDFGAFLVGLTVPLSDVPAHFGLT